MEPEHLKLFKQKWYLEAERDHNKENPKLNLKLWQKPQG